MTNPSPSSIDDLLALMHRLRAECPWDRAQTFSTIAPYTIEEAYEVAEAIAQDDMDALRDELGDLLFQAVYHAEMASERGAFAFDDVVAGVVAKMIRRHPHVFGTAEIADAAAQTRAWEEHKAAERAAKAPDTPSSVLDGVPLALPALTRAVKLQKRMQRVGFDWPALGGVLAKLREELGELEAAVAADEGCERIADEFGDLLFVCANLSRFLDTDPEAALRGANAKVERRFRAIEAALRARGLGPRDVDLAELDRLWDEVKAGERQSTEN